MRGSNINFAYFEAFFLKISTVKKFSSPPGGRVNFIPAGGIVHVYTKFIYDLTNAIINKCFNYQNDWLKIIRIRYNCMQFCPIPLC